MTVEYQLMKQLDLEDEIDNHSSNDTEKLVINFLNKLQECPIEIEDNFKGIFLKGKTFQTFLIWNLIFFLRP